jgi:hypothetical protein
LTAYCTAYFFLVFIHTRIACWTTILTKTTFPPGEVMKNCGDAAWQNFTFDNTRSSDCENLCGGKPMSKNWNVDNGWRVRTDFDVKRKPCDARIFLSFVDSIVFQDPTSENTDAPLVVTLRIGMLRSHLSIRSWEIGRVDSTEFLAGKRKRIHPTTEKQHIQQRRHPSAKLSNQMY